MIINNRRLFLGLFTAAAAAPLLPTRTSSFSLKTKTSIDQLIIRRLVKIVPNNPTSRRLGRALFDQLALEFNPLYSIENLFRPLRERRTISIKALQQHLDKIRQEDFAKGNTMTVTGWILARSEAEVIAIASAYRHN